jgi:bacterioferritin
MKSDPQIIDLLDDVLTNQLTAVNQYFIHAKMCRNWGHDRLAKRNRDESIDEMKHADWLETQLSLIEQIGAAHYLAQPMRGDG